MAEIEGRVGGDSESSDARWWEGSQQVDGVRGGGCGRPRLNGFRAAAQMCVRAALAESRAVVL